MPMPRNAEIAAAIGQSFWLSMPCITATTDSPSRISVNRPNRSGRWAASGGALTLWRTVSHGVPRSMTNAAPQIQNRAGAGTSAERSHRHAAAP